MKTYNSPISLPPSIDMMVFSIYLNTGFAFPDQFAEVRTTALNEASGRYHKNGGPSPG